MTPLEELKAEVRKYFYMEDDTIIDASMACIVANRMKFGNPVWMVLIGASSGGKSQILKPLSMTNKGYMHSVDDVTESTFLSAAKGEGEMSLLKREVKDEGMLVMSDLTVLFSKNKESRDAVLSQFRLLYDGEMTRYVGNSDKKISWKGHLGIIAGSTPSIYRHFEEVSDMGERFMYWRLKPYDEEKATHLALTRKVSGKNLDSLLADLYDDYMKRLLYENKHIDKENLLTDEQRFEITQIALLSEKIRTGVVMDFQNRDVERIPVPAFPMRTALQLQNVAKGLVVMRGRDLDDDDMAIIRWMGWSLANEERRACLNVLAKHNYEISTKKVADAIGLSTNITRVNLQSLAALNVVDRGGTDDTILWKLNDVHKDRIRQMCGCVVNDEPETDDF